MQESNTSSHMKEQLCIPNGVEVCQVKEFKFNNHIVPKTYLLYEEDTITIKELTEQYISKCKLTPLLNGKKISFYMVDRNELLYQKTLSEVKELLNNPNFDSFQFQPYIILEEQFQNQCYENCQDNQKFTKNKNYREINHKDNHYEVCIELPQFDNRIIYDQFNCNTQVKQQFLRILTKHPQIWKGEQPKMQVICSTCKQVIDLDKQVKKGMRDHLVVKLSLQNVKELPKQPIVTTVRIQQSKTKTIGTFNYQQIMDMKVHFILNICKVKQYKMFGLRIFSKTIKPNQIFNVYDHQQIMQRQGQTIDAYLIPQNDIFYSSRSKYRDNTFTLDERETIMEHMTSVEQRNRNAAQLNNLYEVRNSRRSNIDSRFSNTRFFDPIFSYTSPLFYQQINKYLRKLNYSILDDDNELIRSRWELVFTFSLIDSLMKLPNFTGTVYRGVDHVDTYSVVGRIINFKPFTSTSRSSQKALHFGGSTLYIIQCISGKDISSFSYYQGEQQVLFLPHSYFEVININNTSSTIQIYLREITAPRKNQEKTLLWVDDHLPENHQIFCNLNLNYPNIRTEIIQIMNNENLQVWLETFGYCPILQKFKAKRIQNKINVITDMRRGQDMQAGVRTIQLIRQYFGSGINIYVFVGDVEATRSTLLRNNIMMDNIQIGNHRRQVKAYIQEKVLVPDQLENSECQLI